MTTDPTTALARLTGALPDESKATCLWLKNLPPLQPTEDVREQMLALPMKARSRVHYASPGPDRWRERSRTLPGIAAAMAAQWGAR